MRLLIEFCGDGESRTPVSRCYPEGTTRVVSLFSYIAEELTKCDIREYIGTRYNGVLQYHYIKELAKWRLSFSARSEVRRCA